MARIKVQLKDSSPNRVVWIDPDATVGAQLEINLFMPDGRPATPASFAAWLGAVSGGSNTTITGVTAHRLLQGLTLGDDHPQYTRKDTLTALGDIYVRGASTPERFVIGDETDFLRVEGGTLAWVADNKVQEIIGENGILVDDYFPLAPRVGLDPDLLAQITGSVQAVIAGHGIGVDDYADPANPIISVDISDEFMWTGLHTFSTNPQIRMGQPGLNFFETDQAANAQRWRILVNALQWRLQATNDDASAQKNFLTADRNAASSAITAMELGNSVDLPPITVSGSFLLTKPIRLKGYTVATLPAGTQGDTAFVTDALLPVFLVAAVGGGAVVTKVFHNGTTWIVG